MKIVNRQPVRTADASSNRDSQWRELRQLTLMAALLVVAVFFSVGWIVDWIVPAISVEREAAMFSAWSAKALVSTNDQEVLQDAQEILMQLVSDPAVPTLPYRLTLIQNPKPNAFAFPGGMIGLTTGLLETLDSRAAMAFVLGHELGHFQQRDHLRGMGRAIGGGIALAVIFGGEMGQNQFANTFTHILSRSYSRKQEEGADRFGLALVHRVLGDIEGADQLFVKIDETDEIPEWAYMLSTHPAPADRIRQLRAQALELQADPLKKIP